MALEAFSVGLYPKEGSPFLSGNTPKTMQQGIRTTVSKWPELQKDVLESERRFPPNPEKKEIFVYQTENGLFQVYFVLGNLRKDQIQMSAHFAYVNPRTIYMPFCEFPACCFWSATSRMGNANLSSVLLCLLRLVPGATGSIGCDNQSSGCLFRADTQYGLQSPSVAT